MGMRDRGQIDPLRGGNGQFAKSVTAARKRDRACELRSKGWTYQRVADECGYANAGSAKRAIDQALAMIPQDSCEELIRQEESRLAACDQWLADLIADPPPQVTAAGKVCIDPTTGEVVRDKSVVVRAISERRHIGESLRKMRGADARVSREIERSLAEQQAIEWIAAFEVQVQAARVAGVMLPTDMPAIERGHLD